MDRVAVQTEALREVVCDAEDEFGEEVVLEEE